MSTMRNISLYGLQRTGTNLLKWVLERNYIVSVKQFSKHRPFKAHDVTAKAIPIVITTKNLYAWLPSLYRWRNTHTKLAVQENEVVKDMTFKEFVCGDADPISRWNKTNASYLSSDLHKLTRVLVRYEDIYFNAEKIYRNIGEWLGLTYKGGEFTLPVGRINTENKDTSKIFDTTYYTQKKYLKEYDTQLLNYVKTRMHVRTAELCGYDILP